MHGLSLSDGMQTHSAAFHLVKDLRNALHPALKISREEIIFDTSPPFSKVISKQIRGWDCYRMRTQTLTTQMTQGLFLFKVQDKSRNPATKLLELCKPQHRVPVRPHQNWDRQIRWSICKKYDSSWQKNRKRMLGISGNGKLIYISNKSSLACIRIAIQWQLGNKIAL